MTLVRYVGVLATALALAGCASGTTGGDDAASSSTSTTSAIPAMTPVPAPATPPSGKPVAFRDYLASINVTGTPVHLDNAPGLSVTVPIPGTSTDTSSA